MSTSHYELTFEEAKTIVDNLKLTKDELRTYSKRSDSERLALGIVILHKTMSGKTIRDVEAEMGIPRATVQRYKEKALMSIALPSVDTARQEEIDRLDVIIKVQWPLVEAGDEKATNIYLKVSERRAKLLGLDRPIEISSTVLEVTAAERELQDMLAQAERDSKMAAESISEKVLDTSL